jgi:YhcG PDDEXK nuclease domain
LAVALPSTFYLDLLFYHIRLHCYFIIELKVGAFKPEYAGKLSFYLSAVDGIMRTPVDGPSVGVLLCESRSGPIVEYALQNIVQPMGVSTYRVTRELPEAIQAEVPSIEDLEGVVEKLRSELDEFGKRTKRKHEIAVNFHRLHSGSPGDDLDSIRGSGNSLRVLL